MKPVLQKPPPWLWHFRFLPPVRFWFCQYADQEARLAAAEERIAAAFAVLARADGIIAQAEATLSVISELAFMIDATEARYAAEWPTMARTGAGAVLLGMRPWLGEMKGQLREAIVRTRRGEVFADCPDLPAKAEELLNMGRRLLALVHDEIAGKK